MTELAGKVGFASPISEKIFSKRQRIGVELFATVALAVSLVVAATAVSIGMARAQARCAMSAGAHAPFAFSPCGASAECGRYGIRRDF